MPINFARKEAFSQTISDPLEQTKRYIMGEDISATSLMDDAFAFGKCTPFNDCITIIEDDDDYSGKGEQELAIDTFYKRMEDATQYEIGHQINLDFDYEPLHKLLKFHLNNIGDPFLMGAYEMHSREFEIGVLNWFASLWGLKNDEYWGYVTTGGTEGNMHGIYVGRELHPNDAILYASKDVHYSVFKIARLYRMNLVIVDSLSSGAIDCDHLETLLLQNKGKHAIINVTLGTTFKGAIDDLDNVINALNMAGYKRHEYYIHCDGALAGIMLPFIQKAPLVSFERCPIGSMSMSGHKFIGSPVPCGVVITRKEHHDALLEKNKDSMHAEYLANMDTTISGGRSGLTPIILWYALSKKKTKGFQHDVQECLENAKYLKDQLVSKKGIDAVLNDYSCVVVFPKPSDLKFIRRWQLCCYGDQAHVFVLKNVTKDKLDLFVKEFP